MGDHGADKSRCQLDAVALDRSCGTCGKAWEYPVLVHPFASFPVPDHPESDFQWPDDIVTGNNKVFPVMHDFGDG